MNNLEIALKELDEEWFAGIAAVEDMPPFEVSKRYLKWEQRVIYGKKSTANKAVKVLLLVAAMLILFSIIALSTTKGREFILQFFKDSAVYSLQADQSRYVSELEVDYLPEGFVLERTFEDDTMLLYRYEKNTMQIEIQKNIIETTANFDYSDKNYEVIEKNGVSYLVSFADENICSVIWNMNNYYYHVSGNVEKEEALKIAFGVQ